MKSIANRQRVDEDQRKFRFGHRDQGKSTDLDEEEQCKPWMCGRKSANPQCLNGGVKANLQCVVEEQRKFTMFG